MPIHIKTKVWIYVAQVTAEINFTAPLEAFIEQDHFTKPARPRFWEF